MYEPREDSLLLQEQVKKYANGLVLDVGTGSGIQAITAAKKKNVKRVVAVDVSRETIDLCKKDIKNKKIKFLVSDLFSNIKVNKIPSLSGFSNLPSEARQGRFDTIIFNPPYLPEDIRLKDITVTGGKKGYEIIERFFSQVNNFLKDNGKILIVFSSLTKKVKVDEIIKNYGFEFKELKQKQIFFEILYAYSIWKSNDLKILSKRKIKNIKKFTRGKRGIIYVGNLRNKKIAVKFQRRDIPVKGTVDNERKILKILNKYKIGPRLLFYGNDYFAYYFIEGEFINKFLEKGDKKQIKKILVNVFKQCFLLDELKINKEEMHKPYKHIIITKGLVPMLVDFERAKEVKEPKNVTQFCQFLMSRSKLLNKKGFKIEKDKIIELAKIYKREMSERNFKNIIKKLAAGR